MDKFGERGSPANIMEKMGLTAVAIATRVEELVPE